VVPDRLQEPELIWAVGARLDRAQRQDADRLAINQDRHEGELLDADCSPERVLKETVFGAKVVDQRAALRDAPPTHGAMQGNRPFAEDFGTAAP
jgi:hypothetical protein